MDQNIEINLTKVAEDIYSDGIKDTIVETSRIGVDAVKTLRLALAPLQFAAVLQDRLADYFRRAFQKIPEEKRISPMQSLALPIMEKLRYQEDGDLLTSIYIDLLSTTFDKDRFDESHPAFLNIVSQLSSDEAILLNLLADSELKVYFGKEPFEWAQSAEGILNHFRQGRLEDINIDWRYIINPDYLSRPKFLQTYIGHMVSLGVIEYTNEYPVSIAPILGPIRTEKQHWALRVSRFGRLFHKACVRDAVVNHLKINADDRI